MNEKIESYWNKNKVKLRELFAAQPLNRVRGYDEIGLREPAEYLAEKMGADKYFMCCVLKYGGLEAIE